MSARRFTLPAALALAIAAMLSAGTGSASADDCGRGPRYYRSSYAFRSGGCYAPPPAYYYRSYSRGYCAPAPYYGGGFGFSFGYSRGGFDRDCYQPRFRSYRGWR